MSRSRRCESRSRIWAGRERLRAGGGELDGERERVEAAAELGDLVARLELGALAEEGDGLRLRERWDRVLDLALHAQELAARDEESEVGAALKEGGELGGGLDHLLQVVEEEQQLALADVLGEAVLCAEGLGDRLRDERGVAQGGEPDPEDACLVLRDECGSRLEREPGLARAPRPGQGDEPRSLLDQGEDLFELAAPCPRRNSPDAGGSCSRSS